MRYVRSPVFMDKGELYTVADLSLADEGEGISERLVASLGHARVDVQILHALLLR